MRILTGTLRGKPILFRPNARLRPTADKVRKAIFDILKDKVPDSTVLDLFSGTGALGFEALSQGAKEATFVEADERQARQIGENAVRLGLDKACRVISKDAFRALYLLNEQGKSYDIVFLDPPYEKGLGSSALAMISAGRIVHEDSLVVMESRAKEREPDVGKGLERLKSRVYGQTRILIYRMRALP